MSLCLGGRRTERMMGAAALPRRPFNPAGQLGAVALPLRPVAGRATLAKGAAARSRRPRPLVKLGEAAAPLPRPHTAGLGRMG